MGQQPLGARFSRLAEEDSTELQSATDGLFEGAHALDSGVSIIGKLASGKCHAQILDLLVLSAGHGTQARLSVVRHEQSSYILRWRRQGLE